MPIDPVADSSFFYTPGSVDSSYIFYSIRHSHYCRKYNWSLFTFFFKMEQNQGAIKETQMTFLINTEK